MKIAFDEKVKDISVGEFVYVEVAGERIRYIIESITTKNIKTALATDVDTTIEARKG